MISEQISKKRPDAAVPPGKFDGELLLSRLCWRWAEDTGHQGHCKNVIEYAAFLRAPEHPITDVTRDLQRHHDRRRYHCLRRPRDRRRHHGSRLAPRRSRSPAADSISPSSPMRRPLVRSALDAVTARRDPGDHLDDLRDRCIRSDGAPPARTTKTWKSPTPIRQTRQCDRYPPASR